MIVRFVPVLVILALVSCGKTEAPPQAGPARGSTPAAKVEAPAKTPTEPASAAAVPAPVPVPAAPTAESSAGLDKDKLSKCYSEVYCAQKKGEMEKILPIYKSYGFNTPQEFTKAWIEAAKDTDWVTKLAYEVSKKCATK